MLKKILFWSLMVLLSLFLLAGIVIFHQTRPSGNINRYLDYMESDTDAPSGNQVKVTFFGVSTLLLDDGETQLLIDGFFTRYSMFDALTKALQSDTTEINKALKAFQMNRVRGIFPTHSHYDHAFDIAHVAHKTGATVFGSVSSLNIARGGNVSEEQLQPITPNEKIQLGKFSVQIIPSIHSPGNALKDNNVIISTPIRQPAKMDAYSEGGSFDYFIEHNGNTLYIKPSPNFIPGALSELRADVLFMGIATVSKQSEEWRDKFYKHTVGALQPKILIPLHWDNFFLPQSGQLQMLPRFATRGEDDFNFFISKLTADSIDFKVLQGQKSILLFQ